MKILILGAGKMGSFFVDLLSFDHETAVYDIDPRRLRFMYNTLRFTSLNEIDDFAPELVINAVTLKYTLQVFETVIPHLPKECIISDIASVKTGLKEFYEASGMRYVSTHPMFGPTFANLVRSTTKMPSSSTKVTTWDAFSSATSTVVWASTFANIRLANTTKRWPIR